MHRNGVDVTQMSRKQTSYWLVDLVKENKNVRLTRLALESDGSFFKQFHESNWPSLLFGCSKDKCQDVIDLICGALRINEFSDAELNQLKDGFSATYIDPLNVVDYFVSYVDECSRSYRTYQNEFFAPHIALVQSSGSGKSRLLREVSNVLSTIYVCFRTGESGYPLRSTVAIDALFGNFDKILSYAGCIEVMVERLRCAEMAARRYLPRRGKICAEYDPTNPEFPSEQLAHRLWSA